MHTLAVCVGGSSWVYLGLGHHSFILLFTEPCSVPGTALRAGNAKASHMHTVPSSWSSHSHGGRQMLTSHTHIMTRQD